MNLSVTAVMAEYDRKADSYGREPLMSDSKSQEKYSFFSNNDELNAANKRTSCEKKCGDQRTIVDFIGFYPVKTKGGE